MDKNKTGRPKGHRLSQETKEKISKAMLGDQHPLYGKSRPIEVKEKISESLAGRPKSEETKRKISLKKRFQSNGRKVYSELLGRYTDDESRKFLLEHKNEILRWDNICSENEIYYNSGNRYVNLDIENSLHFACNLDGSPCKDFSEVFK